MDEPLRPCEVFIPFDFNPVKPGDQPVPVGEDVMAEILSWFDRQFGGYTPLGVCGIGDVPPGCWNGQFDRLLRVRVFVHDKKVDLFREVVRCIGVRLRQKAMAYTIGPPSAYIMEIQPSLFDTIA